MIEYTLLNNGDKTVVIGAWCSERVGGKWLDWQIRGSLEDWLEGKQWIIGRNDQTDKLTATKTLGD